MSIWIDVKYANLLGSRLNKFKQIKQDSWTFRCPICNDSKKSQSKTRGYIYKNKVSLFVKCFNCGYSTNLGNFIRYLDPLLYQEYTLDNYKESGVPRSSHKDPDIAIPDIIKKPTTLSDSILGSLKRLDQLSIDHPAVKYALKRKIPAKYFSLLYYAPKFKSYVNSIIPDKFKLNEDHPRLIIPYFNNHGKCFAFQGRAFGDEEPKYITIKIDENEERIYGLDRVDYSKKIYVTEGPLDSLFIPNAIAVSGSSFDGQIIRSLKSNCVIIYDNEPRSITLIKLIKKTIEQEYTVCLWPETVNFKDINEAILNGYTSEQICDIINKNTFKETEALLRFSSWKKC